MVLRSSVLKSEFSCPDCKSKDERIKELTRVLILIINSWDNCSKRALESLIEKARELTEYEEV